MINKIDDSYESASLWNPLPNFPVYGGQIVSQALLSSYHTIEDFRVHSLHCYFISPGDPLKPIKYDVSTLKDGRSFSLRRIDATQNNKTIFTMNASFCKPGKVDKRYQSYNETITNLKYLRLNDIFNESSNKIIAKSFAYLNEVFDIFYFTAEMKRYYKFVLKTKPVDEKEAACFVAFISDFFLIEAGLIVLGVDMLSGKVNVMASVDHSLHVHQDIECDEEIYYLVAECGMVVDSSVCCHGVILNSKMEQVATVYQEGVIKVNV